MKNFFNFKTIKTKMLFGFSLIVIFVVGLGVYNHIANSKSNDNTTIMVEDHLPVLIADYNIALNNAERLAAVRGYLLLEDNKFKELFNTYTMESEEYQTAILNINDSEEARQLFEKTAEWTEIINGSVFKEFDQGNKDTALKILDERAVPLAHEIMEGFNDLAIAREELIKERGQVNITDSEKTSLIGVIVSVAVVLLSITVALITASVITKPIITVMNRMKDIANGNLSLKPLEVKYKDETGQLIQATNEMSNNTRELLNRIQDVSETVTSQSEELTQSSNEVKMGTEQVASTMQELASGAESQANNANELSNSMTLFTSAVQKANENGEFIKLSSDEVLEMTQTGAGLMKTSTIQMDKIDQIVHNAVDKVDGLDTHTQEISELVSVIQDISDQTNLLALNAAIEAARAGEHGQGFAVVADEVRKLAEQSSNSVMNITDIVNRIQRESGIVVSSLQDGYKEVEQGTGQIRTTVETFNEITTAVTNMVNRINDISNSLSNIAENTQKMNSSVQDIAAISEESAAGVEQTSASTQQTSASMEDVSESSSELANLATELNDLVLQFKL